MRSEVLIAVGPGNSRCRAPSQPVHWPESADSCWDVWRLRRETRPPREGRGAGSWSLGVTALWPVGGALSEGRAGAAGAVSKADEWGQSTQCPRRATVPPEVQESLGETLVSLRRSDSSCSSKKQSCISEELTAQERAATAPVGHVAITTLPQSAAN